MFQEQAIRSSSSSLGGGKNYDSVSNNDRDGYGQPDGKKKLIHFYFYYFYIKNIFLLMFYVSIY